MPTPDDDIEQDEPQEPKRNFRRELEDRATTAETEAARLRKENAIFKAGLNGLTDRQVSVLASQIDGEATPDAVKALAAELGWHQPDQQDPGPDAAEVAALERATAAATGSTAPSKEDPQRVLEQALAEGGIEGLMRATEAFGLPTSHSMQ